MKKADISLITVLLLLPIVSGIFLLRSFKSPEAFQTATTFGVLWGISIAVLGYYKFSNKFPIKVEKDLTPSGLGWTFIGYLGVLAVAYVFINRFFSGASLVKGLSFIVVPRGSQIASLSPVTSDIVYNASLVVPAEELMVLAAAFGLMNIIPGKMDKYVSFTIARVGWSAMHYYQATTDPMFFVAAFISGMIMTAAMFYTNSILAPYLIHWGYNSTVIVLSP